MADLKWDRDFALEQAGDEEEILEELLGLFLESTVSDLEKIKHAVNSQNTKEAGDAAHSIKGAAASLGIEAIRSVAYDIEKAGRLGDLESIRQDLPELEELVGQLDTLK